MIYDFDGTLSPGNMQEYDFIPAIGKSNKEFWHDCNELARVQDAEMMERISQMRDYGAAFMKDCPMAIMVAGDESVTDLWVDNCSISATILQLAVTDAGLGSCWVHINGRPKLKAEPEGQSAEEYLREFLPMPAEWRPLCFIALGYPAQEVAPHSEKDDSDKVIWVK